MISKIKIFAILFVTLAIVSCSKDDVSPEVSITVDKANITLGETVTFTIVGEAETYAIFTGDASHEFSKSHLAITEGLNLDQEKVVLTADSLTSLTPWLTAFVNTHNAGLPAGSTPVSIDAILSDLQTIVGKEYSNKETAVYEIFLFLQVLDGNGTFKAKNKAIEIVAKYFENHSVLLAPEEGFSTGFAIGRYDKTFKYTYSKAGLYTVTLIATGVSSKQYSGSGYKDDRTSSGDEYGLNRTIKELSITVQ